MTTHKGPVPEGTPCPNCKSSDRALRTLQLNLTQWRCGQCDRFLEAITIPGRLKTTKKKEAWSLTPL